jgi:hypothetical protein
MPQQLQGKAPIFYNFLIETLGSEAAIKHLMDLFGAVLLSRMPLVSGDLHGAADQLGKDPGTLTPEFG